MDEIFIAYALNDKYAEMTCVSICSVIANSKDHNITFCLFSETLSQDNEIKLSELSTLRQNVRINFYSIHIDENLFVTEEYSAFGSPNLTKEAYARVFIPELLSDLDRVLYLDCDTIVEGDILQLWMNDLDGALVGMIPDYSLEPKEVKKQILGLNDDDQYFNTGVLLMDITGLCKFQLSRKVIENVTRLYKTVTEEGLNWFADQDVLNHVLCGKIKKLPMRYNSYFWMSLPLGESIEECVEAFTNPVIVHFVGTPKPTALEKVPVNLPEWERYYKYKAVTQYASDDDSVRISAYKKREINTLDALMPFIDENLVHWYSFHFSKQMFELALQKYRAVSEEKSIYIWGLNNRTWTLVVFLTAKGIEIKGIVDGLDKNQGINVFNYVVESPEILRGGIKDSYIMLDMRNYEIAHTSIDNLKSWGYTENNYQYIYAPIWEGTVL